MELKEFIKKFAGCQMHEVEVGDTAFDLYGKFFPEALQNFADKICEKQKEDCVAAAVKSIIKNGGKFTYITQRDSIVESPQPKIEEL